MEEDDKLIEAFWRAQGGKANMDEDLWFYGSDWNMLMPVVEKIISLGTHINIDSDRVFVHAPNNFMCFKNEVEGSKVLAVRKAVVEYIKSRD